MAGLRLGTSKLIGKGNVLRLHAGAHAVHEFDGGNWSTVTIGNSIFQTSVTKRETFGRTEFGAEIDAANGVSGFFKGTADLGGHYEAYGVRGGISLRF